MPRLCNVSTLLFGLLAVAACPSDDSPSKAATVAASQAPALPALDAAAAAKAVAAIESAPKRMKGPLAAAALSELERERLGPSFVDGLEALNNAPADQRMVAVAEAISKNISMLDAACAADGSKTMSSLPAMDVASRDTALWSACKFERLGLVTKAEGMASESTAVLLAHMAFATVKAAGPVDANERALLKLLATTEKPEL